MKKLVQAYVKAWLFIYSKAHKVAEWLVITIKETAESESD